MKKFALRSIFGFVALASLVTAAAAEAPESIAVITHFDADTVSIIDVVTQKVVATVTTGESPHGVAISPRGDRIYVSNEQANSVMVLDSAGTPITEVSVGQRPNQVGITPDGKWLYVTIWGDDRVDIIDTHTNRVIKRLAVGRHPHIALPAPDGTLVYVTNEDSSSISVVDTRTQAVTRTIPLYGFPRVIAITPDGETLFVNLRWLHGTLVVDAASGKVTSRIDLPKTQGFSADGKYAHGLAVTPDGKELWVTSQLNDMVYVYDLNTRKLKVSIPAGSNPNWIAFTSDGRLGYISNTSSNDVTVIDVATRKATATVPVGPKPKRLAVGTLAAAATVKETWLFDADRVDEIPAGIIGTGGDWRVVADDTAPSGDKVLAQQAKSSSNTFNVALFDSMALRDVDISVQLQAIAGRIDQGGGVIWRAQDARNYYIARYNPLEDNYRVYYVKDGRRVQLKSADVSVDPEAWHTLRVEMQGDHIQCFLEGTKYLDVRDATFTQAGTVGLWTKADAQTHFDSLTVQEPGN